MKGVSVQTSAALVFEYLMACKEVVNEFGGGCRREIQAEANHGDVERRSSEANVFMTKTVAGKMWRKRALLPRT